VYINVIYRDTRVTSTPGTPTFGAGVPCPTCQETGKEFAVNKGDLQILNYIKPFSAGIPPRTPLRELTYPEVGWGEHTHPISKFSLS